MVRAGFYCLCCCFQILALGSNSPAAFAATSELSSASEQAVDKAQVERLIDQLGDEDYHLRCVAEQLLVQLGADVFDRIQSAQTHPDLEIAERASYILQKIRIQWVRDEDPQQVRELLHRYEDLSVEEREQRLAGLAALDNGQGLPALSRIVRFEPSLQLARRAALRVLEANHASEYEPQLLRSIGLELGPSNRVPTRWLRLWAEGSSASDQASKWLETIDEEIKLVVEETPQTSAELALLLVEYSLNLHKRGQQPETLFEFLKRRTDLALLISGDSTKSIESVYLWMWQEDCWEPAELIAKHYAEQIQEDRLLSYLRAIGHWKFGQDALADRYASQAFSRADEDTGERQRIGSMIGEMGRHDWAEREWQFVVDNLSVLRSAEARRWLASLCFHDRGENKQAAQLLADVCNELEKNKRLKAQVMRSDSLKLYFSQRDYFLACQARDDGDYKLQRELLESAYRYVELDADVLIAMYHAPEADEAYRKKVKARIGKAAIELEKAIREQPLEATWYNHWAWLISNTEGDFDKAVEYSKQSLELSPNSPSYQDTLGRCYYAAGQLEQAVEIQRESGSSPSSLACDAHSVGTVRERAGSAI